MSLPNIVFIFSDQQRYDSLGCTGNTVVRTPNFDRIASEGVVFDQAFASCPICAPYRAELVTGKYPHKNGVVDNEYGLFDGQTTIAQSLQGAGYHTAFVGKWHLGFGPYTEDKRYGFDYMAAYNCEHHYYSVTYHENEDGPHAIDGWAPIGETDLAIGFMANHKEQQPDCPFFLMMSWGPPHWPCDEYPEEFKQYRPEDVILPPNVPEEMLDIARKEYADYYGNVAGLDAQMGKILAWLDENGLRDNTILCFTSDHGDHLYSHGYGKEPDGWLPMNKRASKATPYDESIHVPFLMRYPDGIPAGSRTDVLFSNVDAMPTLLGMVGLQPPAEVQGVDVSSHALGQGGDEPDSVYLQILGRGWPHRDPWVGIWRGIRTKSWMYARWEDGDVWLFDRENDPLETRQLAGNPEYKQVQDQMERRLQKWIADTEDPFETAPRDPETGIVQIGQYYTHEKYLTKP